MIESEQDITKSALRLAYCRGTEHLIAIIQAFPGYRDDIERLRSSDLVFDEICRDYETLIALLPCDANDPSLRDIQQSLSGLEQEIQDVLCLASPRQSSRTGKSLNPSRVER